MITDPEKECVATVPFGVGDAVGVESRKWFVAIVNHNTEKAVQERLDGLGYETYVAKQTVVRIWKNGRKAKVDKVIIPSLVFVKCTQKERHEIVSLPYIKRFMTD
ncbi:MAG: UpxY family transcription antiterminator, partial [Muribaculaceae bacterium]|nr:UpxY family transcription antiterminator [Muribaculaceae bacterium]